MRTENWGRGGSLAERGVGEVESEERLGTHFVNRHGLGIHWLFLTLSRPSHCVPLHEDGCG